MIITRKDFVIKIENFDLFKCPKCECNEIKESWNFCPKCGRDLIFDFENDFDKVSQE